MCKLCRIEYRLPAARINNRSDNYTQMVAIQKIALDYFCEYICTSCACSIVKYTSKFKVSIDAAITRRLFTAYATLTQRAKMYQRIRNNSTKYRKPSGTYIQPVKTVVETCITRIYVPSTQHTIFSTVIIRKAITARKSFKTLDEARQFKQEVLNGSHGKHNTDIA